MEVKKFLTRGELLEKITNRGFKVSDKEKYLNFLKNVNYYNISAYFNIFKPNYNADFENIFKIYMFDKKLRNLIFYIIDDIEMCLRTRIAYIHSQKYNPLGYLDASNFNQYHDHINFFVRIDNECIKKNEKCEIMLHHKSKYDNKYPLWVLIEFFSLGMLSKFYVDMHLEDRKVIAKEWGNYHFQNFASWLKCLTLLRNKCAHYSRLYFLTFSDWIKLPPNFKYEKTGKLFDHLLVLKFLYPEKENWSKNFVLPLKNLIEEYKEYIKLEDIGFLDNWEQILSN